MIERLKLDQCEDGDQQGANMLFSFRDGVKKSREMFQIHGAQLASREPRLCQSPIRIVSAHQSDNTMTRIEAVIGYSFNDRSLLIEAFSLTEKGDFSVASKRLASLGDAVLRIAVLEPWYQEGTTTVGRGGIIVANITSNASLAAVCRHNHLDSFIGIVNPSLSRVRSLRFTQRTLGNFMETIFGAVYLDTRKDIEAVKAVMRTLGLVVSVLNLPERPRILYSALDG
ncbi:MAG: hypothetical protein Q9195_006947 [Heterodermia aff. obscurata]